jgi:CheY-like chemotaxis protein
MSEPRLRLLVVDDDVLFCRAMARLLRRESVITCHDPHIALALLEQGHAFDVVLCDIAMPEIDGVELCARIERIRPDLVGRVILVTGGPNDSRARALTRALPTLQKPATPAELNEMIRRVSGHAVDLAS